MQHSVSELWMRWHAGAPVLAEALHDGHPLARGPLLGQLAELGKRLGLQEALPTSEELSLMDDGKVKEFHVIFQAIREEGLASDEMQAAIRRIKAEHSRRWPPVVVQLKPAALAAHAQRA